MSQTKSVPTIHPSLQAFDQLPDGSYMRPQPCAQLIGVSIATFWRLAASGQIKTHKLTERTTTVRVGDLRAFLAKKIQD